ncbi:MAG: 3-deoxy-manno-octulosonate cytidylyltransferase [Candidatus Methylomirabilales bacterium]
MKAVGVIPARYASSRFPGKALASLCGRPVIQHVYERARRSKTLGRVVVATDDLRIRDAVVAFDGEVQLTGAHHPSGTDRVAEVAVSLSSELVVNIQGDEPLIEPAMIDEAVAPFFVESDLVMGTLCRRIESEDEWRSPHVVKVVRDRQGFALYFSRAPIPYHGGLASEVRGPRSTGQGQGSRHRTSDIGHRTMYYKHIGLYVYRRDFLLEFARLAPTPLEEREQLEQLRGLEHGYAIRVVETKYDSIGVDTPEDLERIERLVTADASRAAGNE